MTDRLPDYAIILMIGFAAGIIVASAWMWIRVAAEFVAWMA